MGKKPQQIEKKVAIKTYLQYVHSLCLNMVLIFCFSCIPLFKSLLDISAIYKGLWETDCCLLSHIFGQWEIHKIVVHWIMLHLLISTLNRKIVLEFRSGRHLILKCNCLERRNIVTFDAVVKSIWLKLFKG